MVFKKKPLVPEQKKREVNPNQRNVEVKRKVTLKRRLTNLAARTEAYHLKFTVYSMEKLNSAVSALLKIKSKSKSKTGKQIVITTTKGKKIATINWLHPGEAIFVGEGIARLGQVIPGTAGDIVSLIGRTLQIGGIVGTGLNVYVRFISPDKKLKVGETKAELNRK